MENGEKGWHTGFVMMYTRWGVFLAIPKWHNARSPTSPDTTAQIQGLIGSRVLVLWEKKILGIRFPALINFLHEHKLFCPLSDTAVALGLQKEYQDDLGFAIQENNYFTDSTSCPIKISPAACSGIGSFVSTLLVSAFLWNKVYLVSITHCWIVFSLPPPY